jgi:RNA polymerase sigma-70 factor (ECF subfamily)
MIGQQILQAVTRETPLSIAGSPMDSEEFAAFYGRAARPLWAYLARVSGDGALADDLMQESFVRFLSAASPADGEVEARKYLFRIATNLLKDHWRKPKAQSLEEVPEYAFAETQHSENMERQTLLMPALAKLRPSERQMLWLAHAEEYSHREIADIMGYPSASIRLLLFRARKKLGRLLREEGVA